MKNKNYFGNIDKRVAKKVKEIIKQARKNGANSTSVEFNKRYSYPGFVICGWGRNDELKVVIELRADGRIEAVRLELDRNDSPINKLRDFSFDDYAHEVNFEVFTPPFGSYASFTWEKFYTHLFRKMNRYIINYYVEAVKLETERANSLAEELRDCRESWKTIRASQVTTVPESPQVPAYRYPWGCS